MTVTEPVLAVEVPRTLTFVTVKRNLPRLGRSYGHWWLELDDDRSYGWWPSQPLGVRGLVSGTTGVLNGGECGTRDPNHGLLADHEFHPTLVLGRSDDEVRAMIHEFATRHRGEWRWSIRPSMNCRLFQLQMFDVVGLVDGTGNFHTRGDGCPWLAPVRRLAERMTGRRRWPLNLPVPGPATGRARPPAPR